MLYTDNIGLKKPAYSEPADIADLNENSDMIDREFGNRYLKSETYSVEQANNAIAQAIEALPNGLVYRGAVNYYKDLPTANNELGDTYSVKYQGETGTAADGNEYAWGEYDGALQWIKLGVNAYNKDEIDAMHDEMQTEIDTNKSDILLLEENKLNLNFGYTYAPGGSSPNWYKLAICEFPVPSNGEIRDTTLYIEKVHIENQTTSEYECILKINVIANANNFQLLKAKALINNNVPLDEIKIVAKAENGNVTVEVWTYLSAGYSAWRATMINNAKRADGMNFGVNQYWKLLKNREPGTVPDWTSIPEITDCYAEKIKELSDRITTLENK